MVGPDGSHAVIRIGSNIQSLGAQRQLDEATSSLSSIYERLSSGLRINRASDDAAGLAIASSLDANRRVFSQGIRNLNDGISLLNIADGTLEQLGTIVTRLKELAEQAANGTYGVKQRKALDDEAQALSEEYFRIERSTKFNGQYLFHSSFGSLRLQAGFGLDGGIQSALGGAIGTGTFASSISGELNANYDMALGDINNDGILDMVGSGPFHVEVRLGQGNGTFGAAATYSAENSSTGIVLGDLNNDGVLDLVTAGTTASGQMTVRLGLGNGGFGASTVYATEATSSDALVLGDLNGDGILDVVTAGNGGGTGRATVRLGTGSGTFGAAVSYATEGTKSWEVALGDMNGDGALDLVTTGESGTTVRLGNGNGGFGNAASYGLVSDTPTSLALRDFNGDGILDVATGARDGITAIRFGAGSGALGNATTYSSPGSGSALAWASEGITGLDFGDVNGDGFLDMAMGVHDGGVGKVFLRLGSANGTFGAALSYDMSDHSVTSLALRDLNNDGVLDLITSNDIDPGANLTVRLANTESGVSPLLEFQLTSRADALQALSQFTHALERISKQRGTIGAFQSRIGFATNTLQSTVENYAAAASRIKDTDIASDAASLVRTQILQQAASAVLAQANLQPALAVKLLQG